MNYIYSIIIPHKNTPQLLVRCLDSIPAGDDIQIIIVDDNSDPAIIDFTHFPGSERKNTEVIFTKEGKGAGYARNVGLQHATGKWIIFADADDFFNDNSFAILNEYIDSHNDVIYFNARFVMSDNTSKESKRGTYYNNFFNDSNSKNRLRYQSQVPWCKMVKRDFISTYNIKFDEIRIANDVYFSCLVGVIAKNVAIDKRVIYYCTESDQSLAMSKQSRENLIIRFNTSMKCNKLLRQKKVHYYLSPLAWCIPSAKIKEWLPAKYFFKYLFFFRFQAFKEVYYAFSAIISQKIHTRSFVSDDQKGSTI